MERYSYINYRQDTRMTIHLSRMRKRAIRLIECRNIILAARDLTCDANVLGSVQVARLAQFIDTIKKIG